MLNRTSPLFSRPGVAAAAVCSLLFVVTPGLRAAPKVAGGSGSGPTLSGLRANETTVPSGSKFELTFEAGGPWSDPFDPEQVAVDCLVERPDGSSFSVPAFYYQGYTREEIAGREHLAPLGVPCWKARLTPTEVGVYHYHLRLVAGKDSIESAPGSFTCTANGGGHGFIRVSTVNPHYFQWQDGRPFFAVGEDMLCPSSAGTYAMDHWLTRLAHAGGNLIRTWWCYGGTDLEDTWSTKSRRSAGRYDLESAWRADQILDLAQCLGVEVMPTIEAQQYLRKGVWWERFSYNRANGGPLAEPADFFTSAAAARLFRARLRYIVARWSYSPAIFSWMFWNEVDSCNNYDPATVSAWHRSMARYLRSIDPNHHLIDSNFGNLDGRKEVDDLPEMSFVATNLYTQFDEASASLWAARFMSGRRAKPYLLAEFGLGHYGRWAQNDPTGIALHNGLWGCAFGGAAGGAMAWEWDDWVDQQNLYHLYTPFADFMRGVPFNRHQWKRVDVGALDYRSGEHAPYYANVFFEGFSTNYQFNTCPQPLPDVFRITPEGTVDGQKCFNAALAPRKAPRPESAAARNNAAVPVGGSSVTLLITMPRDGKLIVQVPRLAGGEHPILVVTVDGQVALRKELERKNPHATWDYFGQFPVPLAAGSHRVTISNARPATADNYWSDRLTVAFELTDYRLRHGPNLECVGLQSDACILLWLRNPEFTWLYARLGRKPVTQPEGLLHLQQVPDGEYQVTWIDTLTGAVLRRDQVRARDGRMVLVTPPVARSAAAKLIRIVR